MTTVLALAPVQHTHLDAVLLLPGKLSIGSAPDCTLSLPISGVQSWHCLILASRERILLKAWDQRTWINELPVKEQLLRIGDRVAVGPVEFEVRAATHDELVGQSEALAAADSRQPWSSGPQPASFPTTSAPVGVDRREREADLGSDASTVETERLRQELQQHLTTLSEEISRQRRELQAVRSERQTELTQLETVAQSEPNRDAAMADDTVAVGDEVAIDRDVTDETDADESRSRAAVASPIAAPDGVELSPQTEFVATTGTVAPRQPRQDLAEKQRRLTDLERQLHENSHGLDSQASQLARGQERLKKHDSRLQTEMSKIAVRERELQHESERQHELLTDREADLRRTECDLAEHRAKVGAEKVEFELLSASLQTAQETLAAERRHLMEQAGRLERERLELKKERNQTSESQEQLRASRQTFEAMQARFHTEQADLWLEQADLAEHQRNLEAGISDHVLALAELQSRTDDLTVRESRLQTETDALESLQAHFDADRTAFDQSSGELEQ